LFVATGVINARVGSLVAAAHTLAVALLGTCAVTGHLRLQRGRVLLFAGLTAALTLVVIGGTRTLLATRLSTEYLKDKVLASMHLLHQPIAATVYRDPSPPPDGPSEPLQAIAARNAIRVGYLPDALPFAFFNESGELVGFDVELAHRLASEMGVGLTFVPVDRQRMNEQLDEGYCDIVMSGVSITTDRARDVLFSDSYLDETLALVVPDHERDGFETWDAVRARTPLVIAVPNVPYYVSKLRELVPSAVIQTRDDVAALFSNSGSHADAIALPAERGSAWTLMYPQFSVVVPGPGQIRIPLAYPIARHDERFVSFINTWIGLKRKDGTIDRSFNYWILGRDSTPRHPRWSILRDVLHWAD
jgi:ABC-type amino acid transport substrate-binding protein